LPEPEKGNAVGEVSNREHQAATFQRQGGSKRIGQRSEQPLLSERQMLFIERMAYDFVLWRKLLNTFSGWGKMGNF